MSACSSSSDSDPSASYSLVDKTSGVKIGDVILCEGQVMPDMGQVELRREVLGQGTSVADLTEDVNGNKVKTSIVVSRQVSSLVETLDGIGNYKWSCKIKSVLKGKLRELLLQEIDNTERESDKKHHSFKFSKVTEIKFATRREVLGLSSESESSTKYSLSDERFIKPFQFGWLRKVRIRLSDGCVTSVGFLTPPDSRGKRHRFCYKNEIAEFLTKTESKNLVAEDFYTVRKVLGVSDEYETISYSTQPFVSNSLDQDSVVNSEVVASQSSDDDQDSSDATLVDDSSSSDSSSDDDSESDSDDSSDNIVQALEPTQVHYSTSKDLSTSYSDGTSPPAVQELDTKQTIRASFPLTTTSVSSVVLSPASSFSPSVASSPVPHNSYQTASPVPRATIFMASTDPSTREGGRRQQKMMIKSGVKVIKGMKIFGRRFEQDLRTLRFYLGDVELTGDELAGRLDGARIRVEGLDPSE